ncbi:MAG: helix-turn-helix domain-containing protein [Candidatus Latescibacteria bacterium]|nr:helix-turn-helix domain-containing protein [Candidatus Latescibacterota bacterium]
MTKERLMTMQEVAEYLQCSLSTIRRWVVRGKVPHYRMGKLVRFRRAELDRWLEACREGDWDQVVGGAGEPEPAQLSLFALAAN